jgi:NADPH-dependent ferric siderophore reductase
MLVLMSPSDRQKSAIARLRREPPPFRRVVVMRTEHRSPRLARVTLGGPELEGFAVDQPAASVRLLLPSPGTTELVVPTWHGNEFLLPDGSRPTIRTLTPRRWDPDALELDVEIVVHGGGVISGWALSARPGAEVAISGPGRGYAIDHDAPAFLLAGDETAVPAISQLLEELPHGTPVAVHVEIAAADARLELPAHPGATVEWHELAAGADPGTGLLAAVRAAELAPGLKVWVAGEAAGVQRVRRHLFDERGIERSQATVRGYWKRGRAADGDE